VTGCSRQLTFSFYQDKRLVADFKGGQISSDAGLLSPRALDEKLGWTAQAAGVIDEREGRSATGLRLCLLLNFGASKVQVKRAVNRR